MTVLTWHAAMDISSQVGLVLPAPIEGMSLSSWCVTKQNNAMLYSGPASFKIKLFIFLFLKALCKIHSILSVALTTLFYFLVLSFLLNDCPRIQIYLLRQDFRKYFSCNILQGITLNLF